MSGSLKFIEKFRNKSLYEVDVKNNKRQLKYWSLDKRAKIIINFKKPKSGVKFSFQNKNGGTLNLANFKLIDSNLYPEIPKEHLEEIVAEDLDKIIGTKIIELVNKNLPKVIYWKYDDKYLLPPSISINNLNSCTPLKNIFILDSIPENEIIQRITEEKQKSPNAFRSLLRRVSATATKYFREAWKEYKDIKFSLAPNGDNIECGVEDKKNIFDFQKRSDGFKRFISILLLLSIPAKKALLKNALILIDEADLSLHPKGCRYLMEQLIKLAENNYVIYSTHSIFMIDRENINRHYIVEKNNEITTIKEASEENYKDEEVIYNALGTSAYEILEEKNIFFEGWTDKNLFETSIKKDKKIKKFFKKIGRSHAIGIKSIKNITPIIELSNRKIFILSDGDQISKQEQKEFQDNKGYGIWKRYDEIFKTREIVTSEDFVKSEALKKVFFEVLKNFNFGFQENDFQLPEARKLDYVRNWLKNKNISKEQLQKIIKKLKENVFKNLQVNEVEEDYFDFIKNLRQEISKL